MDARTLQSRCESGPRAGYDGYKRKRGSKVHMAVDTLGHLLAVHVTPADEQERAQVKTLCEAVQHATGHTVETVWVDQGYTGAQARQAAEDNGIDLQIVKLPEAKKGFVLLPRRWVVERSFGWLARFRRLSRDYEWLPDVLSGLHFLVFAVLMLVAPHPLRGELPHLVEVAPIILGQPLVANLSVEALHVGILLGLAWLDVFNANAMATGPVQDITNKRNERAPQQSLDPILDNTLHQFESDL